MTLREGPPRQEALFPREATGYVAISGGWIEICCPFQATHPVVLGEEYATSPNILGQGKPMKVLRSSSGAINEWNALFQGDPELCHSGLMVAVFDCLQQVPGWANWMAVQPSGEVMVCALPPLATEEGWHFVGRAEAWGSVESGQEWQGSVEAIHPALTRAPDGAAIKQHCIRNYRRLLPDTTVAVTMDACGTIRAWAGMPCIGEEKWTAPDSSQSMRMGRHAHPERFNWKVLLYVHADAGGISHGALQ